MSERLPSPTGEPPPRAAVPRVGFLALITIFIVYGSLYPFAFHVPSDATGPFRALLGTLRDWDGRGDLLSNILLYLPFGFVLTHALPARIPVAVRLPVAIVAATVLSSVMELTQFYDAGRVTSMGDVYANVIGASVGAVTCALLGAGMRWPLVGELDRHPDAALLLAAFVGYRLYPYVPVIDLHKYWHAVGGWFLHPVPPPSDLARFAVTWLFIAVVVEALYGFRRWLLLFPLFAAGIFLGRILIVDLTLTPADVIGAAIAFILWAGPLRWLPGRPVVFALLFAGLIAALRLQPFSFSPTPLRGFGWIPFFSLMHGSIGVAIQAFLEKCFQYGGSIWLLRRCGMRLTAAVALTAALLFVTSYAEIYLPDRSGEITDAAMAVGIGLAFRLLCSATGPTHSERKAKDAQAEA